MPMRGQTTVNIMPSYQNVPSKSIVPHYDPSSGVSRVLPAVVLAVARIMDVRQPLTHCSDRVHFPASFVMQTRINDPRNGRPVTPVFFIISFAGSNRLATVDRFRLITIRRIPAYVRFPVCRFESCTTTYGL